MVGNIVSIAICGAVVNSNNAGMLLLIEAILIMEIIYHSSFFLLFDEYLTTGFFALPLVVDAKIFSGEISRHLSQTIQFEHR